MSKKFSELTEEEIEGMSSDDIAAAMELDNTSDEEGDTNEQETPEEKPAEETPSDDAGDTDDAGEEGDTKSETPSDDPYVEMMKELGIDERYEGKVGNALKALSEKEKTLTQTQMELAEARKERQRLTDLLPRIVQPKAPEPEKPAYDPEATFEKFTEDPQGAIKDMGVATRDDIGSLQTQLQEMQRREAVLEIAGYLSQHEQLKDAAAEMVRTKRLPDSGKFGNWDKLIGAQSAANLIGEQVDDFAVWDLLIPKLFGQTPTANPNGSGAEMKDGNKPPVKVDEKKREHAKTAGGPRKSGDGGTPQTPNWDKMSADEIQQWFEDNDLVTGS